MNKLWCSASEATAILSEVAGRAIPASYVRSLAKAGKITSRPVDGRSHEYSVKDCQGYTVQTRAGQKVAERVRDRRSGKPGGRPRKLVEQKEISHGHRGY